jgi:hypothetical protein
MAQKETRTIMDLGGSLGITLPFGWLDFYKVKPGDKVEIVTHGFTADIKLLLNNKNIVEDGERSNGEKGTG